MLGVVTASFSLRCQLQLWETLGFAAVGGGFWLAPVSASLQSCSGLRTPRKLKGVWAGEVRLVVTQFPLLLCICYRSLWVHLSSSLGSFHGQICSALLTAVFLLVFLEP